MKKTAAIIITTLISIKAQAGGHIDDLKFRHKYKVDFGGFNGCASTRSQLPPTTHTVTVTAKVLSVDSPSCKLLNDY